MSSEAPPRDAGIRGIPALLRWDVGSVAVACQLRARLVDAVAERVGTLIARRSNSSRTMLDDLFSLPRCERIFLAPAITAIAAREFDGRTDGGIDAWACFTAALEAEQTLAAHKPAARPLWTALGDAYLPSGFASGDASWPTGASWRADAPYQAPRVLADTVVDAFSPGAVGWLPDIALGDGGSPAGMYDATLEKLRAACATIEHVVPAAETMSVVARVIVLRSDAQLGELRAASSPIGIGRIVLRNPHLTSATVLELVDGLVHETIHGLVDLVELTSPVVAPRFAGEIAASPWTGREIDLRTYVHACFVWYGLWQFWSRIAAGAASQRATRARHYMALCLRGFIRDGGILAPIANHVALLGDDVLDVLRAIQAEITTTSHAEEERCLASTTS